MSNLSVNGVLKSTMGGVLYDVDCIVEKGTNYIRYSSGLQIVYGEFDASGTATITLPIPFIDTTYQIVFGMRSTNSATMTARALSVISKSTTTFQKGYTNASFPYSYIAIGKWK